MKLLEIATMMDQRALVTWSISFLIRKQLADELHKPVIKKFKRRKVYKNFKDNIWVTDLIKMVSLPTKNKSAKYLLCVIDVFNNMKRLNL